MENNDAVNLIAIILYNHGLEDDDALTASKAVLDALEERALNIRLEVTNGEK